MSVEATQASAASVAGPASAWTRSSHCLVDPGGGERLGQTPRLGDAEVLEAVGDLVLGVGGVERADRLARGGLRDGLLVQRDELRRLGALDARTRRSARSSR